MRAAIWPNCGSVRLWPSASAISACRVGVSNAVLPESWKDVTAKRALGGSVRPPGCSMLSPVPVPEGAGGSVGCVCCRIELAPGTTGWAASTHSGSRTMASAAASLAEVRGRLGCIDVDQIVRQLHATAHDAQRRDQRVDAVAGEIRGHCALVDVRVR